MALHPEDQEWRDFARQVSIEMDPAKLTILVGKLCRALDERNERQPQAQYPFLGRLAEISREQTGSALL